MRTAIFFSDALFICGMVFVLSALMQVALNFGFFGGASYGFKSFYRFFRKKNAKPEELESGYARHIENRSKHSGMLLLLFIGAGLILLAVLFNP